MIVELIEGMEELFLRAFFSRDDVDVVDQQYVRRTVMPVKQRHSVELDRRNHLVHESLARRINDVQARVVIKQTSADCVHQMRLSDTHSAVDEKRIVAARRRLCHRLRSGVRELIRRTNYVAVESKSG